ADSVVEQPSINSRRVIDLCRVGVFRGEAVVKEQRPSPGRLGQVAEHLAVRIDRAADEPSTVHAQQDPIPCTVFCTPPHRGRRAPPRFSTGGPAPLPRVLVPPTSRAALPRQARGSRPRAAPPSGRPTTPRRAAPRPDRKSVGGG